MNGWTGEATLRRHYTPIRLEDRPLRHMAVICYLLMQAGSNAEFLEARQVLDRAPSLFACPGDGAVAWRCRQMLRSTRLRIREMSALPCHLDPREIEPDAPEITAPIPACPLSLSDPR